MPDDGRKSPVTQEPARTVERWETPVSDARSLRLVSLVDDGALRLTLEDAADPVRRRWTFVFASVPAYRNVREELRLGLWAGGAGADRVGWTARVPGSPWLARLREAEPLLDVHHPGLVHFRIATEDDVIDVLSALAPEIEEAAPAPRLPA
ncbi:MAG: hypothetical protein ABW277_25595 [Longimicrobiaceae bacterium]